MYLGIEIGGTKLQLGLGPGDGTLLALWRDTVVPADRADGIRRQITQAIPELLASAESHTGATRAASASASAAPSMTPRAPSSNRIKSPAGTISPSPTGSASLVGLPAVLGNDADVAGLAEALFGAGKGLSPIFYITIGSGIGGGLIINGEIYRGCGRGAAEIGHVNVFIPEGHPAKPYEHVSLEALASGWAIQNHARWSIKQNPKHESQSLQLVEGVAEQVTAEHVAQAAQQGDCAALSLLEMPISHLADGICHVIALLCPRRIVIGGGVSLMGEQVLFEPLRKLVAERVFKPFADCYDIVPAALGEEVVIHGALALARKRLQK